MQDKGPENASGVAEAASQILKQQAKQNPAEKSELSNGKPVGIDIGTSKIVLAEKSKEKMKFASQLNAFITVDYSKFTAGILKQNRINHYKRDNALIVYGDHAETFANMLNAETRRPMRKGLLNPQEASAVEIIKEILDNLVEPSNSVGSPLCFSIPGVPKDAESDIIYHEAILKRHLAEKGYEAKSINKGLAVVFSELENENFTGFGISCGGGICNVCLAYLSVPLLSFSINKGGDYIDDSVAAVTGEVSTRVRTIKENDLNLRKSSSNDIEDALHIYYDDLIMTLVKSLHESINQISKIKIRQVDKPIPIVLSGGTAKPNGFRDRFETLLKKEDFPLAISEVRLAGDPVLAAAKGSLIAAMYQG